VHRRQGLGRRLIEAVLAHPELQGLRRLMLVTRDAHALYRQLGFTAPRQPEMLMEKRDPEVYRRASRD
jgi:ribosomal protein S18 acetylase RimI-like enzyme